MCFNKTKNYQFTTQLKTNGHILNDVDKTKLLGVIVTNDLDGLKYKIFSKKASSRMKFL